MIRIGTVSGVSCHWLPGVIVPPIVRTLDLVMKDKNSLPIASRTFIKYLVECVEHLP